MVRTGSGELQTEPASPNGKSYRGRQRSPRPEVLLVGALCLVIGVLVGRQTLTSESANLVLAGAGIDTTRWPLRGGGFGRSPSQGASPLATAGSAPKTYYLPNELGVHHYTVSGKLDDGTLVVLHLWLVMTRQPGADGGGGNITMQGYGFFQPIDKIRIYPGGELIMPDGMGRALEQGDSLYLQQRYTDRRFNISTRLNSRSQRAPFHLTCTFPDDVGPPGLALDLHVRNWRRFLELPVDHMLAVWPDTARGRYRVAVWMTPEMTGPQAARLVALHARYHVGVLGFHEEQVYMHPDQLAHCLRDADVMEMVGKAQLKLVLIDNFPEIFTYCKTAGGNVNSSISDDVQPCAGRIEMHGNQVLVNAHLLLANLGSDAYLFNVDLDEYLVTDNRTTLPELIDGCFRNQTTRLPRMNVLCSDCEENNLSEGDLWMDRSRIGHPLAKYGTVIPPSHKNPSTKTLVKPDDAWSIDVHNAMVLEGRGETNYGEALACGAKVLHVFNMFRTRAKRTEETSNETVTYLWAIQESNGV